jgi:hypothetical protein
MLYYNAPQLRINIITVNIVCSMIFFIYKVFNCFICFNCFCCFQIRLREPGGLDGVQHTHRQSGSDSAGHRCADPTASHRSPYQGNILGFFYKEHL